MLFVVEKNFFDVIEVVGMYNIFFVRVVNNGYFVLCIFYYCRGLLLNGKGGRFL